MNNLKIFFFIFILLIASCSIGPEYTMTKMPMLPTKFSIGNSKKTTNIDTLKWWESFKDDYLNKLVQIALKQNLTILQAKERINIAKENILSVQNEILPSLQTSISHNIMPKLETNSVGKLSSNWKIDPFGQKKHTESSKANFDGIYAQSDIAKLTIISKLISSYINARHLKERIYITNQILDLHKKNLELNRLKFSKGAISKLSLMKIEAEIKSAESEIYPLEKEFRVNVHNISTLLGYPATEFLYDIQRQPNSFQINLYIPVNIGIPADLIRNRPDIRYQEKKLTDYIAKIGIAKSDLYPSISLNGSISLSRDSRFPGNNTTWSFGPTIYMPIFDQKKTRSNIRKAEYLAQEQYISWKETVLNAIKEVENALSSVDEDKKNVIKNQDILELYEKSTSLSMINYIHGKYSLHDILEIQHNTEKAKIDLSIAKKQLAKDYVDLYVAIGSGYNL
ncbi:efflux transporter outer membrane subunit [Candidatus Liberibacter brunswickensis]|uniref:efflux transporter outer membrane subunit n=1 Tax=Candidatus Liberibacter brunswickensis TaxID=1968796 RepID=UPI002FE197E3